jgi:hypothetical protein
MFNKKEYNKQWYQQNRERILEQKKEYSQENKERKKEYNKQYRENNREKLLENSKKYYYENREQLLRDKREWYWNNLETSKERCQTFRENNPEKIKELRVLYRKKYPERIREADRKKQERKMKTDYKYNLNRRMSRLVNYHLKGNKNNLSWRSLVGYTLHELIKSLEATIPKGYTWQDFMDGNLHIDHVIPMRVFTFNNPKDKDFKECWSLSNLRLLPAKENLNKQDNIDNPILLGLLLKGCENHGTTGKTRAPVA